MMEFSGDKRFNHFFIEENGKIIEISVYTIHPTADPQRLSEPLGYYAAGRLWSPEYLQGISELTGTGLEFPDGGSVVTTPNGNNDFFVTNLYDLKDNTGKKITHVISFKEFTNLKAAYSQFRFQLIVMNFIVALVLIFSTFVLYHIVNKPLRKINKSLLTGESIHILPLINKRNEFGYLAKMINDFFEQKQTLLNEIQERIDAELKIKISEEKLKGSLQEKEVLIKEVHHRVKNNLQIIISLIRLQANRVSDENLNSHLNETLNRIKSIALVHEMLYKSDDLSHIEFKEYIHKITESLRTIYADKTGKVRINVQSDDVYLTVDKAVPCAIIINELVTNSIKHAFKKNDSGDINISMNRKNGFYSMKIADNGSGLASGFKIQNNRSLGMTLVDSLADQLDADVNIDSIKGTSFDFRFPVN
jgi:two-component sensor histidine kinase